MTGTDVALVITAFSTLVGVMGGILVQLRGQNEARASRTALSNQMEQVKKATDGVVAQLGETKLAQGTAEGHASGLQQGRAENGNK